MVDVFTGSIAVKN